MFTMNEDLSIYATRGDIVFFSVTADDNGIRYKFQPGDIVRMAIYGKKEAETCVMQKDFPVTEVTEKVFIYLDEEDTKIGEIISKHKDYWYEIVLNPDTMPQTIIGYDEDGAKVFRLFPESNEIDDNYNPQPEDFPVVDEKLDMTSPRPVANKAIARAVATILDTCDRTIKAVAENFVTPEMYGAIGDGVADDTEAIQAAIDASAAFSTVRFRNKTYCVSEPIRLSKKVNLIGEKTVLKAIKSMDCVMRLTNQGSLNPSFVSQISVDANNLATVGFKIGGEGHATQITFRECVVTNAVSHGFHLIPVAYIVNFVSCLSMDNGGDGLNAVAPSSSEQINAINIEKCSFQRNTESGMNVNGVNFSITETDSEFNKYGISIGGVNYITYGVFIVNCHFEYNTIASVFVNNKSSALVSVKRCYFFQPNEYNASLGVTSFIKCGGTSAEATLHVDENTFQGNTAFNYVDGGNKLGSSSLVRVDNIDRLVNMKSARIETTNTSEKYLPVPLALAYGAGLSDCNKSENLVGASKNYMRMIVPHNLVNALPRLVGVYVETNGTTPVLRCFAKKYEADGKTVIQQTYYDQTITKSGLVSFNLLNNWGYKRIPNNAYMEIEFVLTSAGNASSFVLSNPYITAYL